VAWLWIAPFYATHAYMSFRVVLKGASRNYPEMRAPVHLSAVGTMAVRALP
jgi:hypothetical protein